MAELPFIVLAFANEQEGRRYLRDLPEELRRLQGILEKAEKDRHCRLVVRPNATLEQIFTAFTDYRDQVAILHYGGHAGGDRLLLESSVAGGAPAYAEGLATFLRQRQGLQLVFLNGCSTRAQVARLLEANVAAVIATARAIDDRMAREFAVAFYSELASGASLRAAFEAAQGRLQAAHGAEPRAYLDHRELGLEPSDASGDPTDDHGFPWELRLRPGADLAGRWNLCADDPLFGLPELPADIHPPAQPFRHLQWYTRAEASVFFGRGRAIRELYDLVATSAAAPIILYYGPTGVGKSSVLEAGLRPRLEAGYQVRAVRRDQERGLLGTLQSALAPGADASSFDLARCWRECEASDAGHRPLIVILDQAEEAFTRPRVAPPPGDDAEALSRPWIDPKGELDELLEALHATFSDPSRQPRGKLILSFRKEWLQEFGRAFDEATLWYDRMPLEPLDRAGIIEAIEGPTRRPECQRRYHLTIEAGQPGEPSLAELIADDLRTDAGSALAPTLQVLVSKMWDQARQANPETPRFDRALYDSLRKQGLLLDDFLKLQLAAFRSWRADVVDSGLVLDLLEYHTTPLGTAEQRTRAELDQHYAHQAALIDGLLEQCKSLYMLIEFQPTPAPATRLAHDTLAPLVQERCKASVAPGQRARRILENRVADWSEDRTGPVLDRADLMAVEQGAPGMRVPTPDEERLLQASREAEQERQIVEKRRKRLFRSVLGVLIGVFAFSVLAAIVASTQWQKATQRERIANAQRLAAFSLQAFPKEPQRCFILAMEAIRATRDHGEPVVPAAVQALEDALTVVWGHALTGHNDGISALAFAPDGRLVTGSADQTARVWDLKDLAAPPRVLRGHDGPISALAFAPDGRLVTGSWDQTARVWDLKDPAAQPRVLRGHEHWISALAFAPDGRLVTGSRDKTARVWDLKDLAAQPRVLRGHEGGISALAFAPDGRLVTGSADKTTRVWDLTVPAAQPRVLRGHEESIVALAFAPDGRLVTGSADQTARVWDLKDPAAQPRVLRGHESGITALAFAPDGRLVTGSADQTARVWDLKDLAAPPRVLRGHDGPISALAFAPDGRLVTGSWDQTARVWDLKDPAAQPRVLRGHEESIVALAFAPDGRLVTGSADQTAQVWDLTVPAAQPRVLRGHDGPISALAFAPDGRLVTGSADQTARVWDLKDPAAPPRVLRGHEESIVALAFAPDGRLVTGSGDKTARVWDLKDPAAPPRVLRGHEGWIAALAFAPDGRLVTGSWDQTARVWDLKDLATPPRVLRGHEGWILALAFAPDGRLVTGSWDQTARVWDLKDPAAQPRVLRGHEDWISALAIAPDGRLVTGSADQTARVWDLKDLAAPPRVLRGHEDWISALAIAPDGRLVTGSADQTARVWDLKDLAAPPRVLRGHEGRISALAIAPDGRLVTGSWDQTARVWDLKDPAAPPLVLRGHERSVSALAIAPDGRLVTAGDDKTLRVWSLDLDKLIQMAGGVAPRNLTYSEWQQFFGQEPYRRTFPDLPDGTGVAEAQHAQPATRPGTLPATPPAAWPH